MRGVPRLHAMIVVPIDALSPCAFSPGWFIFDRSWWFVGPNQLTGVPEKEFPATPEPTQ